MSRTTVNAKVTAWKLKGLPDGSIKPPATSDNSLNLTVDYFNNPKFQVKFNESYLTTDRVFTSNKIMNLYVVFEIIAVLYWQWFYIKKFFIGGVKLTTNPDPDKCSCSCSGF